MPRIIKPAVNSYRADARVPVFSDDKPVIVFDGECVLCSRFAQFVLRRDKQKRFRLLAAQTPLGSALYQHYGFNPSRYETNILLWKGQATFKSDAALTILQLLGFPWRLAVVLRVVPKFLRDRCYDWIAANRLRWFGSRSCFVPSQTEADRFLG